MNVLIDVWGSIFRRGFYVYVVIVSGDWFRIGWCEKLLRNIEGKNLLDIFWIKIFENGYLSVGDLFAFSRLVHNFLNNWIRKLSI